MKKNYLSMAGLLLMVVMITTLSAAPAFSQSVTDLSSGITVIDSWTQTDSMDTDTSSWYRAKNGATALYIQYQAYHSTANPLDTFAIEYKWKGRRMTLTRVMKAIADSTETVHFYQVNYDSLGRPDFRILHKSKRDSTYHSAQLLYP